jgi:hypothetical protein
MIPSSSVVAVKNQISSDLEGEAAILNLTSGVYYGLNAVGARIWHLLQTPTTVQDLVSALLDEYDVDRAQCERDLLTLLPQLEAEGLIEVRHDPPQ